MNFKIKLSKLNLLITLLLTVNSFSEIYATATTDAIYYNGNYSPDHWALQPKTWDDPHLIAFARHKENHYAIFLNPTDMRGYRCIVLLIDSENPQSVFNRDYSTDERIGLGLCIQLMSDVYSRFTPIAQTAVAGNNCHSFDPQLGIVYLGSSQEPSMLHGHIFGRGNPDAEYIPGIKLEGPIPGQIFDMRGKTPEVPGNDSKVKWKPGEAAKVADFMREEISAIMAYYENYGLEISIN